MAYENLIFFAPNINRGGGKYIFDDIINSGSYKNCVFIVDARNKINTEKIKESKLIIIKPKILSRFYSEFLLWKLSKNYNQIIILGNLPPLLNIKRRVVIFFQNRLILNSDYPRERSARGVIKSYVETKWLQYFSKDNHEFIVQTETMKEELQKKIGCKAHIEVMGFKTNRMVNGFQREKNDTGEKTFIYIASGDLHKNHKNLIEAWKILASRGIKCCLTLTIDEAIYPVISKYINDTKEQYDLDIKNMGNINAMELSHLYNTSQVLIYPSFVESLGLPLLEASDYGLEILAPEVDYVRDIINPTQTFDPSSAKSISRAVERCLGIPNKLNEIHSTKEFLDYIIE
ncbi:glycosyltransferase [Polynucleobacter sp. AM-7D1]|uniref:glycosyltransferase n=1 Tax=Polynucleobacter sp. AM-7D1 TaxID=2689102 RepID=UPI001BFE3852|nr:glycosyltransferase [Polynucleobacter sp. AM-7D1]QWE29006.1 glycosyltransferase [Polynucleobacter sp. AM-7D1]